jgi:hypothetical protein
MIGASLSRLLPVLAALAAGAGVTWAQTAEPLPAARLAVVGQATRVESRWDTASNVIVTYVDIAVTARLRGEGVPDRLVLKQLGGQVGTIGLRIADQAVFAPGETALLLLAISPRDGTLHTAGLGRGKLAADAATIARVAAALPATADATPYVAVPPESEVRQPAAAFSYLPTDGGYPARWHEVDDGGVVRVDHPSALPATWSGATSNATAAINLWRNSGMDLDLRDNGATLGAGQCAWAFTGNGRIGVSYNDPCGVADTEADNWVIGGGYYTTGDLRTVNGTTFQKFIQGFVVLNNVGPHTSNAACFQNAVTHGLGHALGLGHSTSTGAIMAALPPSPCTATAGLAADDIAGVTAIYQGIPSGPIPPNAPSALTATALLTTVNLSWTPATSGGPASRYLLDAGTAPGVYNIGTILLNSTATTAAVGNVPAGTYYVRVRAQNAAGTSGPSPEAQVTVGACAPPGAPGTLSGSASNQTVNLAWSAPASGVTQGYRLLVGSAPGLSNLLVADYAASVTALVAPGIAYGTYYTRVAATNVCGVGPVSNEVTLVVQPCAAPPQAPTGLHFSRTGTFVALAWSAPASGPPPTSYTLVVGSQTGGADILVLPTGTTATSTGASAPPGTYYVRVLAQNPCGVSGVSNEIVVVVP